MRKLNKILTGAAAALIAASFCACSVRTGTNSGESVVGGDNSASLPDASESAVGSGSKVPLSNVDEPALDAIVARATKGDNPDELSVSYETFRKEYLFYLLNKNITDDTEESIAETCKSLRQMIIDNLVSEQICLHKAKEYGVYELSDEDKTEVDKEFDETVDYYISSLASAQNQSSTSDTSEQNSLTDEEKKELGGQLLDDLLKKSGLTRDDLHWWAQSSKIAEKLQDKLAEEVKYSEAEDKLKEETEKAQELYKTDLTQYVQGGYYQAWLPDDARFVKHVLLAFDDDTQTELRQLRTAGKDDEADEKRAEAAEALNEKRDDIKKKLDDGANIDELIKEYSADKDGSEANPNGYTVIPNVEGMWMAEFQETAFVPEKIGDTAVCVTDYGVHIMQYVGAAKVDETVIKQYTDAYYKQLVSTKCSEAMDEWKDEYAFEIDYDALRLDDPDKNTSSGAEESSSVEDSSSTEEVSSAEESSVASE